MFYMLISIIFAALAISANAVKNPLEGSKFYVNPVFRQNIENLIGKIPAYDRDRAKIIANLEIARKTSTVTILDKDELAAVNSTDISTMNGILVDAYTKQKGSRVLFNISNLPGGASANVSCAQGIVKYKAFIDNVVTITKMHKDKVPIAFVLEQNAVGWMVNTNVSTECRNGWKEGLNYVVAELHKAAPEFPLYVGLGHGQWLGSEPNSKLAEEVIKSLTILDKIRGFATNIGNYQPVGEACPKAKFCTDPKNKGAKCCINGCPARPIYHDNNEMNYALRMEELFPGKKFVIDTGRNGVSNVRNNCEVWCNVRNVGFGLQPSTQTASDLIDAYLWINNPGFSSGCTQVLPDGKKCDSFTQDCARSNSIGTKSGEPRMPKAGQWSDYQVETLARNANYNNVVVQNDSPLVPLVLRTRNFRV